MKVLWTIFAENQLDNIYDYIQSKNLQSAIDIYNDIIDARVGVILLSSPWTWKSILSYNTEWQWENYRTALAR